TNDHPTSISLSKEKVDYPYFSNAEITSAKWLSIFKEENAKIYADDHRWLLIIGFEGYPYTWYCDDYNSTDLVFLGDFNMRNGVVLKKHEIGPRISLIKYEEIVEIVQKLNKIYISGKAEILKTVEG
ncbi:MAG: DUF2206 domain-containing protein, partial [Candidatus Aenigmatarchaeota archaeon]